MKPLGVKKILIKIFIRHSTGQAQNILLQLLAYIRFVDIQVFN